MRNAVAIKRALKTFSTLSGQEINQKKAKSFSRPTHAGAGQEEYVLNSIVEKVRSKLAGWQTKTLSMAGRAVVIKATTEAIPANQMSCLNLPRRIHEELGRLNRNFLWGSANERKKLHLVNWNEVTMTKEEGGLGLLRTKERNTALLNGLNYLSKKKNGLNWRLNKEPDKPWCQVILKKYGQRHEKQEQGSCILQGLRIGKPTFDAGVKGSLEMANSLGSGKTIGWAMGR